jgi:8-oxo-dGTP diphosphatase
MGNQLCEELIKQRGKPKNQVSLVLLMYDGKVLLGTKKHKFAFGLKNAPGGKQEPGETIEQCAIRETKVETDLDVSLDDLIKVAEIDFYFFNKPELDQTVITYLIKRKLDDAKEISDEIGDWRLYNKDNLPFNEMWPADQYWMPQVLQGKKLKAKFVYSPVQEGGKRTVLYWRIKYLKKEEIFN